MKAMKGNQENERGKIITSSIVFIFESTVAPGTTDAIGSISATCFTSAGRNKSEIMR